VSTSPSGTLAAQPFRISEITPSPPPPAFLPGKVQRGRKKERGEEDSAGRRGVEEASGEDFARWLFGSSF
jgi:hypothetical protein